MAQAGNASDFLDNERLFAALAEDVRLPFIHIAHAVELAASGDHEDLKELYKSVSLSTQAALRLLDTYVLNVRLQKQSMLELEPVAISAVLYDVADSLDKYAKAHNCRLELEIKGKYGPVMSSRDALQAGLTTLGYSFIEAVNQPGHGSSIVLGVRRGQAGITAGIFSSRAALSGGLLKTARRLAGNTHQPLGDFSANGASGVFLADSIFEKLDSNLKVARLNGRTGLAATFAPSLQLSLV